MAQTGNGAGAGKKFLPFKQALVCARSLKLKGTAEWVVWSKSGGREANIPSRPERSYRHEGWQGYGHWLGTGKLARGKLAFLPFKRALLYARSLKLKGLKEWRDWAKTGIRHANMPSRPDLVYKQDGWQGYGHWLGTGNVHGGNGQTFLPFKKALLYARTLKLRSHTEWKDWAKTGARPANMPSHPDRTYKHDGWQGYGHWLGTGNVRGSNGQQFLPFKKALLYARSLNLKNVNEWKDWARTGVRPAKMPSCPHKTYKRDGWQGYGHWLGTGNVASKDTQFLTFDKALLDARSLKIASNKDWRLWCTSGARPANMPSNPHKTYKHDGWQGYGHWLGNGNFAVGKRPFLPFKQALVYARSLKLESEKDWRVWCKSGARPVNIPSIPSQIYKHEGWQDYGHWLGTL